MKKILISLAILITFAFTIDNSYSEFSEGFKDGWCSGFKSVKGEYSICPIAPIAPIPRPNQNTYRDGFTVGVIKGVKKANK